jgi:signal transduction histidine kinase
LRHDLSAEELRGAVRVSVEDVDRLARLADDLLLIARSERGELPLRVEAVQADELLASVARKFQWRADAEERPLAHEAPADLRLRADRLRVEQALGNLVDNALRHGGGAVLLRAEAVNGRVELHVEDGGGGFPPAFLRHAFERFSRPDRARERGGAGLGLSIVRTIAEAHGGSADAANLSGGGADVWLAVPR